MFPFVTVTSCLLTVHCDRSLAPSSLCLPNKQLYISNKVFPQLSAERTLFSHSLLLHSTLQASDHPVGLLLESLSSMPISFMYQGVQNRVQYFRRCFISDKSRGRIIFLAAHTHSNLDHNGVGLHFTSMTAGSTCSLGAPVPSLQSCLPPSSNWGTVAHQPVPPCCMWCFHLRCKTLHLLLLRSMRSASGLLRFL